MEEMKARCSSLIFKHKVEAEEAAFGQRHQEHL